MMRVEGKLWMAGAPGGGRLVVEGERVEQKGVGGLGRKARGRGGEMIGGRGGWVASDRREGRASRDLRGGAGHAIRGPWIGIPEPGRRSWELDASARISPDWSGGEGEECRSRGAEYEPSVTPIRGVRPESDSSPVPVCDTSILPEPGPRAADSGLARIGSGRSTRRGSPERVDRSEIAPFFFGTEPHTL